MLGTVSATVLHLESQDDKPIVGISAKSRSSHERDSCVRKKNKINDAALSLLLALPSALALWLQTTGNTGSLALSAQARDSAKCRRRMTKIWPSHLVLRSALAGAQTPWRECPPWNATVKPPAMQNAFPPTANQTRSAGLTLRCCQKQPSEKLASSRSRWRQHAGHSAQPLQRQVWHDSVHGATRRSLATGAGGGWAAELGV